MAISETKVFIMENARTIIYNYVQQEMCVGLINSVNKAYTVTTAPVSVTGLSASALVQYVDAAGDYFRKDVLVEYRLNGEDTVVDTTTNPITIASKTLTFTTAPAATSADKIVASYCHTPSVRSDEIVNMTFSGGGRPVDFVTVQGGKKVIIQKSQEAKTIAMEVLSVDGGFVQYVNGNEVTETSGNDQIKGSVGSQVRSRLAIVTSVTDQETSNKRIECFFNVFGVADEGAAPSEGYWSETCSFMLPPQDYCRLTFLEGD